jgi:hypothetical protein
MSHVHGTNASASAQNTQSSYTNSASTASIGTTPAGGTDHASGITPHNVHDESKYVTHGLTQAQVGHRLLSTHPPTPGDAVELNSKTRATANSAAAKVHAIGGGFAAGGAAGTAVAMSMNPAHGVVRDSSDPSGGNVDPYGGDTDGTGSSPMSTGSGSSDVPSDSTGSGSSDVPSDGTGSTGGTGSSGSGSMTDSTSSTSDKLQKSADNLESDAQKGGCKHPGAKDGVMNQLHAAGFSKDESNYIYKAMHDKNNTAGPALAQAVVAMQANPSAQGNIKQSIDTLISTDKTQSTNSGALQRGGAVQELNAAVNSAGLSVDPNAFGIGVGSGATPPTLSQGSGWSVWQPETQT